jgi:Cu/Ag efflux pump CusA
MIAKLISWSLQNRLIVLAIAAAILLGGTSVAIKMPVDVFPDLTAPSVTVITEAHGMAPEEVETLVTFPIETAVSFGRAPGSVIHINRNLSGLGRV